MKTSLEIIKKKQTKQTHIPPKTILEEEFCQKAHPIFLLR